jgi:hypothetical protein
MYSASDLRPLLAERNIHLSLSQVEPAGAAEPETLVALMDILDRAAAGAPPPNKLSGWPVPPPPAIGQHKDQRSSNQDHPVKITKARC